MFKKKQPKNKADLPPQGIQDAEYTAVPGGKGGRLRALCGFLAFALGVSLTVEGACFFWSSLSSASGRQWWEDSFQEDYQNTRQFQALVEGRLEKLLTMGAGGPVNGYSGWYDDGYDDTTVSYDTYGLPTEAVRGTVVVQETPPDSDPEDEEKMEAAQKQHYQRLAQAWHREYQDDENILYRVTKDGKVLYENTQSELNPWFTSTIPEGYNFLLQFDGDGVRIWKDGREVDVYGDGYYEGKDGQWFVPGYRNFQAGDSVKDVTVTMAVIAQPRPFIRGSYGTNGGTSFYNQLYYLKQNLEGFQDNVVRHQISLGAGALLLILYLLLRKDKARADRFLARGTGKVWFEVKLALLTGLTVWQLPRVGYLGDVWTEVAYAYDGHIAAALAESGSWMLREYLSELAGYPGVWLVLFWSVYLLLFNDWRYNKRPWRHGLIAGMLQLFGGLFRKIPIERRLTSLFLVGPVLAGGLICVMLPTIGPVLWENGVYGDTEYRRYMGVLALWCVAAVVLVGICYWQGTRHAKDMGQISKLISAIRAGDLEQEVQPMKTEDMRQMADDLSHIQQGLHQAVEERTRSERMKVELVTNVSHDLKTPLTSIISYTELLSQEPLEPPASEYVQILSEKSQRLKAMVQDVFEVSKAASGQLPVKLERLDFGRLLRQTMADMDAAISQSGLAFRVSIPERPIHITADSDRMYRVFQNLIGNALKYSLPGSRVYLTLTEGEGWAAASVKNTSAAELDPGADYAGRFVRGDSSRTDGGSGLGLSIADSFTKACGGQLTITTEADLFTASVRFPTGETEE